MKHLCEKRWEELARVEKSWQEVTRVEMSWERGEIGWAEVRRGGKSWEEVARGEKSWEEVGRGESRWEELRKAGKKWKELRGWKRWKTLRAVEKSCGNWDELRWSEKSCEEPRSGGHSCEGVRQDEDEVTEQSWEGVRLHSSSYRQTLSLDPIASQSLTWKLPPPALRGFYL